jgi:long-chain acyl-CoA synthetase
VREYSTPLSIEIPGSGNLTDDIVRNAEIQPGAISFSRHTEAGWSDVTAAEFLSQVRAVAKGFVAAGVSRGDRVAILSSTRYEWTLVDYAIWFAGAVSVPVYETSSADQVSWILGDSGTRSLVTERRARLTEVEATWTAPGGTALTWALDDGAVEDLVAGGVDVTDEEIEQRRGECGPDSLATIIYTSGTSGRPKGCMLTHGDFMFELSVAIDALDDLFEDEHAATLLFIPLAHVFARIIQIGAVRARVRLGYSSGVNTIMDDLRSFEPTFLLAVPRVFEKVFNTASQRATADGAGGVFDRATDTAIAYSRALDDGKAGLTLRLRHAFFDRVVYAKLRAVLGGRCRFAITGGAPLGERLSHFYRGIGVTVLEGYGLTETAGAVTVNLPDACKIGTVGRPLGGTGVRVADDGELLINGGSVFSAYWNDDEATGDAFDPDGWLRTGDLGEIDDEGFVRITGRKKEILVTAGGKNVAPSVLEDRVRAHNLVSQCMVVGDGKPFVAALVTLDRDALGVWAERRDRDNDVDGLVRDVDVHAEIQAAIDDANESVSQAESIRKFSILAEEWTEEGGQLTPSLKLKRAVVMRQFGPEVDALYSS